MEHEHDIGRPTSPLHVWDVRAARLRAEHPGWRIWYVPAAATRGATWHAQPHRFPLNAASPEELSDAIAADNAGPWKARTLSLSV